ncbi:bifunctional ADP-dependent NAD(P)H-hydrate dehydratase/NAD(P)H-hydrate epimerase [Aurantiacibacter marinus]|uniref:Bifunctional NAD(P)H-hydrate repair enzyme n=1 Tax=Aurantiacibacter marinus TaxID=874156 RepID=A0A0H0XN40_9SPHN|nr:bifunctional ADP-dependent NAD(P)H-hydrate dehydratase/NAD(P)H-hydrate epimerase [Aurantiacibacter marinus]KLI64013.1 hypothetical protein AAV99_10035 [Aurantiacibacter marinus]
MKPLCQILSTAQMRAAEDALVQASDSVETLMERAGTGAAEWIWRMAAGRSVTVLCGPGNNGGDGYVIARALQERGLHVDVIAPIAPKTDAARTARARWAGEPVEHADNCIFVDCLFGTGLGRPIADDLLVLLRELALAHHYCIAVDLPSGVDSDNGEMLNEALPNYDLTIALGAWKFAHWLVPAMVQMGAKRLVDIGIQPGRDTARVSIPPVFKAPDRTAHKYSRGLLAVVAGEMHGAAILAAKAAQHGGAGYVKIFAGEGDDMATHPPDLVVDCGSLFNPAPDHRIDAFLVGPGLGRSAEARARLDWVLSCDLPTVCDADALVLLEPRMLEKRDCPIIVTPHAGELEVLANVFGAVGLDRAEQAIELAEGIEGVLVAKGPDTMIAAPGAPLVIMPSATSWLSTAGTGDILAGLIASRLATGMAAHDAAEQGCWLHAQSARRAGSAFSASDLNDYISDAYGEFM